MKWPRSTSHVVSLWFRGCLCPGWCLTHAGRRSGRSERVERPWSSPARRTSRRSPRPEGSPGVFGRRTPVSSHQLGQLQKESGSTCHSDGASCCSAATWLVASLSPIPVRVGRAPEPDGGNMSRHSGFSHHALCLVFLLVKYHKDAKRLCFRPQRSKGFGDSKSHLSRRTKLHT